LRARERTGLQVVAATAACFAVLAIGQGIAASPAAALTASIGDSFASGEGAGFFDRGTEQGTGNGCERTLNAWPRLLGVPQHNHFACDGATIASIAVPQKAGPTAGPDATSQLARLRAAAQTQRLTRVYVTIGINDLGFGPILYGCVVRRCLLQMDGVVLPSLHSHIGPGVADDLRQAALAAPGAQVVLVGYPDIVARSRTRRTCGWLDTGERKRMRRLGRQLDTTLAAAARSVGAGYVSTRAGFAGHELCSFDSWMTPLAQRDLRKRSGWRIPRHGAHPNLRGQIGIAAAVRRAIPT
jgi:hypothetical protein